MTKQEIRWIDFIPMAIFTWGPSLGITESIAFQYYLSAIAALIQLTIIYYNNWHINYISLGTSLFLLYGAAGYAINKNLFLPCYWLDQSTLFVWVLLIGLLSSFFLPKEYVINNYKYIPILL